ISIVDIIILVVKDSVGGESGNAADLLEQRSRQRRSLRSLRVVIVSSIVCGTCCDKRRFRLQRGDDLALDSALALYAHYAEIIVVGRADVPGVWNQCQRLVKIGVDL